MTQLDRWYGNTRKGLDGKECEMHVQGVSSLRFWSWSRGTSSRRSEGDR
jgi:hypothetical protein